MPRLINWHRTKLGRAKTFDVAVLPGAVLDAERPTIEVLLRRKSGEAMSLLFEGRDQIDAFEAQFRQARHRAFGGRVEAISPPAIFHTSCPICGRKLQATVSRDGDRRKVVIQEIDPHGRLGDRLKRCPCDRGLDFQHLDDDALRRHLADSFRQ